MDKIEKLENFQQAAMAAINQLHDFVINEAYLNKKRLTIPKIAVYTANVQSGILNIAGMGANILGRITEEEIEEVVEEEVCQI